MELLHGPNSAGKWRRKFLFLWFLGVAVLRGSIWFLSSFGSGALGRKGQSLDSCEEGAQVLLRHFNVSKNQLHALGSLFSDSDQIASLECAKEPGPEMLINDGIACVLKVPCSKKQEYQQHIRWVAEDARPNGTCSVQVENESRKLDQSFLKESVSFVSQSTISSISQDCGKVKPCC